jgi:hypothetical protein
MFRRTGATKQFPARRNHFSLLAQNSGNGTWLSTTQQRRTALEPNTGDRQMRTLSFILAFAFVLAGPSLAGSSDNSLPGVGTFAYSGSPLAVPHALLVAAR